MLNLTMLIQTAKKAGEYATQNQDNVTASTKEPTQGDDDYQAEKLAFSEVDTKCQQIVLNRIGMQNPKLYGVIAEESDPDLDDLVKRLFCHSGKLQHAKKTIVLDPLDGSKNYLSKEEPRKNYWAVSIAILNGTRCIQGVLHYPGLNVTLKTEKGSGTYINDKKIILPNDAFNEEDFIRISGALEKTRPLRHLFPGDHNPPRSFAVTLLTLLQHGPKEVTQYKAYFARNVDVVDLNCGELAFREAGGVILNAEGVNTNPFGAWYKAKDAIRIKQTFMMAPSQEYADALFNYIRAKE